MSDEGKAAVVLALWSIAFHAGLFIAATKNRSVGLMLAVCATLILAVSLYADWKVESAKLAEARRASQIQRGLRPCRTGGKEMTNRKFKDFAKNKVVYDCIVENFRNLARIMLTLHKLYPKTFYPKVIGEWLNTYADNCREMDKYDEAGVYDYKMDAWCEEYGINEKWCIDFCKRNNPTITHPQNIIVLANNIKLALVQTCMEFGIGDKRLAEIRAALDEEQPKEPGGVEETRHRC